MRHHPVAPAAAAVSVPSCSCGHPQLQLCAQLPCGGRNTPLKSLLGAPLVQEAVVLNVGGRRFMTTAATLLAVEGSFLWKLISVQQAAGTPKPGAEFFIDRNGSVSAYSQETQGSCPTHWA